MLKSDSHDTFGFTVSALGLDDVDEFLRLQDFFAEEHLFLTRPLYEDLSIKDWQLGLLCPARILEDPGGRERHVESMVKRKQDCFRKLFILKVMEQMNGAPPTMGGYIMFQVHEAAKRPGSRRGRGGGRGAGGGRSAGAFAPVAPWVQVKQVFVRKELRRKGCGKLLFDTMMGALSSEECAEVRLSVLDLNTVATRWYRRIGFSVVNLSREQIGPKDRANIIIYQEMRRINGVKRSDVLSVPLLFRNEVVHEVITIDYPDKSGVFTVRITGYDEQQRWHYVDSSGLSLWDGDTFTDIVNLNQFFRDGFITFQRHLSLIHLDAEMSKRELKRSKAEQEAHLETKRGRLV